MTGRGTRGRLYLTAARTWRPLSFVDVRTAISTKRAVRTFASRPLADGDVRAILDAGRRAGSSKNLQRWDFVVCRDRDHLRELARVGPWAGHLAGAAVAIALVTPDPHSADSPLSVMFDLGQAAQNMMLAAWELGIGSVPATVYEHDLARSLLGYPADRHCEYVLSLGYPADASALTRAPTKGGRRPLDDIVHEERW
jgi:nitroreductase